MSLPNRLPTISSGEYVRHDWLKVCVSCDRHAANNPGQLGNALAAAIEPALRDDRIALRRVPCLSGCKRPANVEFGATGKAKIRFDNLGRSDAPAINSFARLYAASPSGNVPPASWPAELCGKAVAVIQSDAAANHG